MFTENKDGKEERRKKTNNDLNEVFLVIYHIYYKL